jgi:hypothetical protein
MHVRFPPPPRVISQVTLLRLIMDVRRFYDCVSRRKGEMYRLKINSKTNSISNFTERGIV